MSTLNIPFLLLCVKAYRLSKNPQSCIANIVSLKLHPDGLMDLITSTCLYVCLVQLHYCVVAAGLLLKA